jgi:hypothetical protein
MVSGTWRQDPDTVATRIQALLTILNSGIAEPAVH